MLSCASFGARPARGLSLKLVVAATCFLSLPAQGAKHSGPFGPFAGEWRGEGRVQTSDGNTEAISCRARYDVAEAGTKLTQSLVCASSSYRFDIQSNAVVEGNDVTGNWQETTRHVEGPLRGQIGDGDFEGSVEGSGFSATISLRSNGHKQAVVIRPQGQSISEVSVTLKR